MRFIQNKFTFKRNAKFCHTAVPTTAEAHGGRTAADGCHNDKKAGRRHCPGTRRINRLKDDIVDLSENAKKHIADLGDSLLGSVGCNHKRYLCVNIYVLIVVTITALRRLKHINFSF